EGSAGESTMQKWFRIFQSGDFDLEGNEGCKRANKLDDDELKVLADANTRKTVRELAQQLGVSNETISTHSDRIRKTKKHDKWVPHQLNDNRKSHRFQVVPSDLIVRNKDDPLLNRVVTCKENWIL
ncbi:hypothetical protein Angca_007394, partial [Angiostrongylus cantonensis]